jgi:hypothetical protein
MNAGKRRTIAWIVIASAIVSTACAGSMSIRAADILGDVRQHGARAAATTLWGDHRRWSQVVASIAKGTAEWLDVAIALRAGADGGASEELDEAVFLALKPAPMRVLHLLGAGPFEIASVCSSNVATDYPATKAQRFIADRIAVLARMSDQSVRETRDQCVAKLRAALEEIRGVR